MREKIVATVVALVVSGGASLEAAKTVLKVNGKEISDVSITLAMRYAIRAVPPGPGQEKEVLRMTVEQTILRTLLAEEARKAGITVTREEVATRVREKRQQLAKPEIIDKVLKDLHGSEADLFALEEEMLLADKFVGAKVAPGATVSEAEAKAYYEANPKEFEHPEQLKLWMIMAAIHKDASAQEKEAARQRAEEARARCLKGEAFSAVAKEMSDDPSKARGGEIGWVRRGLLFPELEPAVFALPDGGLSEVLESPRGFHVFRVEGRRGPGVLSWDEVHEQLLSTLRAHKLQGRLAEILGPLRKNASIEILDPTIEAALKTPPPAASTPAPR